MTTSYSTVQYSTVQYSTVQYSTAEFLITCTPHLSLSISLHLMMSRVWCRDGTDSLDSEEGMLSAVLDMDEVELYLSGRHSSPENKDQLVMPGAQQVCYKHMLSLFSLIHAYASAIM
jgi:hypothetical protein